MSCWMNCWIFEEKHVKPLALAAMIIGCGLAQADCDVRFCEAKPVWPVGRATRINDTVRFVGTFAAGTGDAAVLQLTGSTCYRVRLNGEFLAFGPVRGPKGIFRVDQLSLKGKLVSGDNRLEIDAYGGNVNNFMYMNQPSFLQAEVLVNGKVVLATGKSGGFAALDPHERVQKVPRFDYQRLFSEAYRIGKADRSERLELEERPPVKLIPRRVPYPEYGIDRSFKKTWTVRRRYDPNFKITLGRGTVRVGQNGYGGFLPKEFEVDVKGEIQRYLPDEAGDIAGTIWRGRKISAGFVGVKVTCRKPGRFVVYQSELPCRVFNGLENDGGYATFYDILEPGEYTLESFVPNGMMYVETFMHGGEAEVQSVWVREYKNPLPLRFRYSGSDPDVATICAAAAETLAQNSVDVFTDCPGRERAAWIGDTIFTGKASRFLTGSTLLEDVFLENYALAETFDDVPEGAIPMLYPGNTEPNHFIPNFCMWFGIEVADYARRGGERRIVELLKPKLCGFVRYIDGYLNADGLLENLPSWVFVEWSRANALVNGVNYPSNMQYAGMLAALGELYGDKALTERADRLRRIIREKSWTGEWFRDNAASDECTECCQYCAFYFGIADFTRDAALWEKLVTTCGPLRDAKKVHPRMAPANSIFGYYMRFDMLLKTGRFDVLDRETRDYFLKMAKTTGTIWENQTPTGSKCHGLSSIAAYFVTHGQN